MPSAFELLDALAPQASYEPPPQETVGDALRKGLNSGTLRAGAQLHQIAGLGGELVGAKDFTASRYADAKRLTHEAEAAAPEINSYKQVKDVGTGLRFGAGLAGGVAPQAGLAVAGTLLGGFPGGVAALTPFAAGGRRQAQGPVRPGQGAGRNARPAQDG